MYKYQIIKKLKKGTLLHDEVPEEYRSDSDIIQAERFSNTRRILNIGYDVIEDVFFVKEEVLFDFEENGRWRNSNNYFENFDDYYKYLGTSSLYENACYYKMNESKVMSSLLSEKEKMEILREIKKTHLSLSDKRICNYTFELTDDEREKFNLGEETKKESTKWIKRFNSAKSFEELWDTCDEYCHSGMKVDVEFFFWNYVFQDEDIWSRFKVLMEYMITRRDPEYKMIEGLCTVYGAEKVLESFVYDSEKCDCAKGTFYKDRSRLKGFMRKSNTMQTIVKRKCYFDKDTHYYCDETWFGFEGELLSAHIRKYFESFSDFINYKKGDLKDCDLSNAYYLSTDFSKYDTNKNTIFPLTSYKETEYRIKKGFKTRKNNSDLDLRSSDRTFFYVKQNWKDKNGNLLKEYEHRFDFFFDFVSFLDGDLSDADLLLCDGLNNIDDFSDIQMKSAKVNNEVALKTNQPMKAFQIRKELLRTFELTEEMESSSDLLPRIEENELSSNNLSLSLMDKIEEYGRRIYYISDLHLLHRIKNAGCKTVNEVENFLEKTAKKIIDESEQGRILLFGGDISSDYEIFELFLKYLNKYKRYHTIVFVLGNHDLWPFCLSGDKLDAIVEKYRRIINKYGMYLLHNSIIYKTSIGPLSFQIQEITTKQLETMNGTKIRDSLVYANLVIFGGIGFSGYNKRFNAKDGIYLNILNRREEINETKFLERMYKKIEENLADKNVVILTHMPKKDWCKDPEPFENFVYVCGHNHRNEFYDDGQYRVYADNQVGYYGKTFGMKYFILNNYIDIFADYEDGIYPISREDYIYFCRGKNLSMTFNKDINELLMLKNNGYYCFLHRGKNGDLSILNGGALKKLHSKSVEYFYEEMNKVISTINNPLEKYTKIQEGISNLVKMIGGSGKIHGCIVDIDFYNHIYVNPFDSSMTAYYALDIINKKIYSSIPALLEMECPELFLNYIRLLEGKETDSFAIQKHKNKKTKSLSVVYLETDIYKASREIRKMQKLYSNVLTTWIE